MLLFTPGPTPVPESIRVAMSTPTIHHRTPEFEAIFGRTRELLQKLYGMPEAVMLASTGSGAMESSLTNLCHRQALTINAGKFGERFTKIAKAFGKNPIELKYGWDTPASVADVEQALRENPEIDALCIQVCESSGGLRHPVELIAKAAKAIRPEIMVIADGITAVGVEPIDTTHIDALIAGSQKAFMLPPGLSMIGLSNGALEKIEKSGGGGYYFNLATELKNQRKNTTAWTAATTLTIGLGAVLEKLFEKGIEVLYKQTCARATATRAAMEGIGLSIYPKNPALSMCTIFTEKAEELRKILKNSYGLNCAGGQDDLKGKIFRISHMGLIEVYEAAWAVNAVELALEKLGERKFDGTANRLFLQRYYGVVGS